MNNRVKQLSIPAVGLLAFAALILPISAVSAVESTTTVNGTVGSAITVSSSPTVALNVTPTATGATTTASGTVTVSTNHTAGYNLALESNTASRNLVKGADTIPPSTGTPASPVAIANNTWGWRVDGAGTFGAGPTAAVSNQATYATTFAGIPAQGTPTTIKTTAATAANDVTTVWYGMRVTSSQPSGVYTNSVLYTALTN